MTFSNCDDLAPKGFRKTSTIFTTSANEIETELYNY